MQRYLIFLGLALVLAGILWPLLTRLGLGRLPGDIVLRHGSFAFYFPVVTCLVISVVLSLALWLINR